MEILTVEFKSPRGLANKRSSLWSRELFPGSTMVFDGTDFVFTARDGDKELRTAIPHHAVAQYNYRVTKKGPGRPKKDSD